MTLQHNEGKDLEKEEKNLKINIKQRKRDYIVNEYIEY